MSPSSANDGDQKARRRFEFLIPIPPERRQGRHTGKTAMRVVRIAESAAEAIDGLVKEFGLRREAVPGPVNS